MSLAINESGYQVAPPATLNVTGLEPPDLIATMDVRRYKDTMRAILDSYPNVYTDSAYMRPHIQASPDSYADFISHYPDRVCFGSDALISQPEIVLDYIELVKSLNISDELKAKVFSGNPRRFLGLNRVIDQGAGGMPPDQAL